MKYIETEKWMNWNVCSECLPSPWCVSWVLTSMKHEHHHPNSKELHYFHLFWMNNRENSAALQFQHEAFHIQLCSSSSCCALFTFRLMEALEMTVMLQSSSSKKVRLKEESAGSSPQSIWRETTFWIIQTAVQRLRLLWAWNLFKLPEPPHGSYGRKEYIDMETRVDGLINCVHWLTKYEEKIFGAAHTCTWSTTLPDNMLVM